MLIYEFYVKVLSVFPRTSSIVLRHGKLDNIRRIQMVKAERTFQTIWYD